MTYQIKTDKFIKQVFNYGALAVSICGLYPKIFTTFIFLGSFSSITNIQHWKWLKRFLNVK